MAVTPFDTPYRKTTCCTQTSCMIERELLPIEVLHCGNRNFRSFSFLQPWPWPDDLHKWTWPVVRGDIPHVQIWTSYVKAFESHRHTNIHTYRQTDIEAQPKLYTMPLCEWSKITVFSWTGHYRGSTNTVNNNYISECLLIIRICANFIAAIAPSQKSVRAIVLT